MVNNTTKKRRGASVSDDAELEMARLVRHEIRAALTDLVLPRLDAVEQKVETICAELQTSNQKMTHVLTEILGELRAIRAGPTKPTMSASFAAVVTRAMTTDRAVIEEKSKNAIFIGIPEQSDALDRELLADVIKASGDSSLNDALSANTISLQRYPVDKVPAQNSRPRLIKVIFPNQKNRDSFLQAGRTNRPQVMTQNPHSFLRRDYTIDEQKSDKELRQQCWETNKTANEVQFVVRDLRMHKLAKPRPFQPRQPSTTTTTAPSTSQQQPHVNVPKNISGTRSTTKVSSTRTAPASLSDANAMDDSETSTF
jgi:hypothetical protein